MKALVQRVSKSSVSISDEVVGEINQGLLILIGIHNLDTLNDVNYLVHKILHLRIFPDKAGKMNLSPLDISAEILVVSQFTLYAKTKKGNRPSFTESAPPSIAIPLYTTFIQELKSLSAAKIAGGIFGAKMQVSLINDGPVTILLNSADR